MRIEELLARLEAVTGGGGQWYARCPAHEDRQASLAIALGRDDQILLTCWAGCSLEAIVAAAGVTVPDLFDETVKRRRSLGIGAAMDRASKPELPDELQVATWATDLQRAPGRLGRIFDLKGWTAGTLAALDVGDDGRRLTILVRDLDGRIVQLLRYWPEAQPKMLATKGHSRTPLYALHDDGDIWIVEGETDAIGVANVGIAVIGAPGASAKAHAGWCEPVRGRNVIVCMDADEPGRKAAIKWAAAALEAGAASVRILTLEGPSGYDVGDIVHSLRHDLGLARRTLLELAEGAVPFEPLPRRDERPPSPAPHAPAPEPSSNGEAAIEALEPGEIVLRPLSSFRVQKLRMLWRERIPVGRLGIIYGPPGQGKSTLLALLVADITAGGGRVLVATAEDDPATTVLPRYIAAGADIGLVDIISTKAAKGDTQLVLPRDLETLGAKMVGAALLLIDPLTAHLGDDVNSWKEQDVRARVMAPLGAYSRETGCSGVVVMHMNASDGQDPLTRISGSGGFAGAARFALLLGHHPDDIGLEPRDRRLALVHVKANESARQPTMIFRRREVGIDAEGGELAVVPTLDLEDAGSKISAETVLLHTDPHEAGAFTQAIEWIKYELSDGPKPAKRMAAGARERGDFSDRTLRKAKMALGVKSVKESDGWWWVPA